jgi:hypothetical protein
VNKPSPAPVFSIVFGITYWICFLYDFALFRYYPEVNQFHLAEQTPALGPPILWYGWVAMAAIVSLAFATLVPSRLAARIPSGACWIVTGLVLLTVLIYERRWFV